MVSHKSQISAEQVDSYMVLFKKDHRPLKQDGREGVGRH